MKSIDKTLTGLRSEIEECGHALALMTDISMSGIELTERGRLALYEFARHSQARFEKIEAQLRLYDTESRGADLPTASS